MDLRAFTVVVSSAASQLHDFDIVIQLDLDNVFNRGLVARLLHRTLQVSFVEMASRQYLLPFFTHSDARIGIAASY